MKKIAYLLNAMVFVIISSVYAMEYEPGPYLGGQLGWGVMDEGDGYRLAINAGERGTFAGLGWRVYIGYSFMPIFSIESGYSGYPINTYTTSNNKIEVRTYTVDLVGKIIFPLGKISPSLSPFSIYGKGGGAYSSTRIDMNTATIPSVNRSSVTIMPAYGAGIVFNYNDNFAIDASWSSVLGRNHVETIYDANNKSPVPTCHLFTLGVAYKITGIF